MHKAIIGLCVVTLLCPCVDLGQSISPQRVQDEINTVAMQQGVSVSLLEAIAQAESNDDVDARNSSSTASGVMQFLTGSFSYWCIDKYKLADSISEKNSFTTQILCAAKMIKDGHLSAWDASESIWKPLSST